MSDNGAFNFGKFVPGFDFLQNLAQSSQAGASTAPPMSHWVAPTLSVEDLDKRISELRTVHFWLEQNARAVNATVQALEVQKMTLNTLQGMNMNLGDLAKAFTIKGGEGLAGNWFSGLTPQAAASDPAPTPAATVASAATPAPAQPAAPAAEPEPPAAAPEESAAPEPAPQPGVDPMQWWGSLSQQFQHIASQAMQDVARRQAQQREAVAAATPAAKTRAKATAKPRAKASGYTGANADAKTGTRAAPAAAPRATARKASAKARRT